MAIYVTRRCPNCRYPFETFERSYIALGQPFTNCPRCGVLVKWDHITEWDLLSRIGKIHHILTHCYTCLLYGLGGALLLLTFVGLALFKLGMDDSTKNVLLLSIPCLIGASVIAGYRTKLFIRTVGESRKRMQDQEYQKKLVQLGFDIRYSYVSGAQSDIQAKG